MTILWGDTGKIAYGPLKTFNFQCATPREVSLGTITLPNVEGATQQVSFTVQQSDLPTITPNAVSMKYSAVLIASGKCVTAATVNYRTFKNGTAITGGNGNSSGTANQFWSQNHWRWYDVAVGDVLEVRMWSSQTDTNLDYACLMIYPANVVLSKANTILKDLTYTNATTTSNPTPTGAGLRSVTVSSTGQAYFPVASNVSASTSNGVYSLAVLSGTPIVLPYIASSSLGTFRIGNGGDVSTTYSQGYSNATNINIQKNGIPASITFREILR